MLRLTVLCRVPRATCWEMASGGHLSYRFVRWRDLPKPLARKCRPEASFRIDLYASGASLGHLLGNGFRSSLFVLICTLPGPPLGHLLGKWPPELTFRIDLYAVGAPVGHLLGNGLRRRLFL